MLSEEREVLQAALEWAGQGVRVALVTVVSTWGSSPRPVGSSMVMAANGRHEGSVSGGCVEQDLVARFCNHELTDWLPTTVNYGVNREQAGRLGLPCGGRLELAVEPIHDPQGIRQVLERVAAGELVARRVSLNSGKVTLVTAQPHDEFQYGDGVMTQVFGPAWQLLLIGAGQLSHYVARIALTLNYRVTVCDPREDTAREWKMEGTQLSRFMPDDAVHSLADHGRAMVVTLTHDPKLDDMALLEALQSKAFYVGSLGSRRTHAARRERLSQLGIDEEGLRRLHGPVGLHIGSRTPAEIAVAIMAEVTAARHGVLSKEYPDG